MRHTLRILTIGAAAFLGVSCFYNTDGEPAQLEDTDMGDTDTAPDGGNPSGLGQPCVNDGECAQYEASACTYSEFTGSGYCTFADCQAGECPGPFLCCHCDGVTGIDAVFCASPTDVSMIQGASACPCD